MTNGINLRILCALLSFSPATNLSWTKRKKGLLELYANSTPSKHTSRQELKLQRCLTFKFKSTAFHLEDWVSVAAIQWRVPSVLEEKSKNYRKAKKNYWKAHLWSRFCQAETATNYPYRILKFFLSYTKDAAVWISVLSLIRKFLQRSSSFTNRHPDVI